jgi:hypothetical protein
MGFVEEYSLPIRASGQRETNKGFVLGRDARFFGIVAAGKIVNP